MTSPPSPDWGLLSSGVSKVRVPFVNETSAPVPSYALRRVAQAVFLVHGHLRGTVSVLVADDERLRVLNREFRGLDETTDVLTFPPPESLPSHLGDIALNRVMARQAALRPDWSEKAELGQLVAHGCLHLLGYEDDEESGRLSMVQVANEALGRLGMPTDPDWQSLDH